MYIYVYIYVVYECMNFFLYVSALINNKNINNNNNNMSKQYNAYLLFCRLF